MKKISVLFTRQHDWFSNLLAKLRGHKYSHVSLSLEEDKSEFYSFNIKGFARETYEKFRRHNVNSSMLYEFEVNDSAYDAMQNRVEEFKTRCREMKYSFLGVALCFFHIPLHLSKHYFCSEFVAEMLASSQAAYLREKPAMYLPEQLRLELERQPGICKLANVV